jgi:hypothetical protein
MGLHSRNRVIGAKVVTMNRHPYRHELWIIWDKNYTNVMEFLITLRNVMRSEIAHYIA